MNHKQDLLIEIAELEQHLAFDPSDNEMREDLFKLKQQLRRFDFEFRNKKGAHYYEYNNQFVQVTIYIPQHEYMYGIAQAEQVYLGIPPLSYHILKHKLNRYVKRRFIKGTSWAIYK